MSENSKIEWCDLTFNGWVGCSKVSPGCENCYAEADFDKRRKFAKWGPNGTRVKTSDANWRKPLQWNRKAERRLFMECASCGKREFRSKKHLFCCSNPDCLGLPETESNPVRPRVFCASLADVFEDRAELVSWRDDLFALINDTPYLDWLLLTKRPENIARHVERLCWPESGCPMPFDEKGLPPNVWLGTSVENQEQADKRIPELLKVPAAVRFLSCEPLLGPVDLSYWMSGGWHCCKCEVGAFPEKDYGYCRCEGDEQVQRRNHVWCNLDWVIVGGESGPNARPMHPQWARSIRDQCKEAGVAFHFKQWGGVLPVGQEESYNSDWINREYVMTEAHGHCFYKCGNKAAGRLLDGRTWDEFPVMDALP